MMKHMRLWPAFLVAVLVLVLGAGLSVIAGEDDDSSSSDCDSSSSDSDSSSSDSDSDSEEEVPLAEAEVFFEFNSTDLDLGLHVFFDGPGWSEMEISGPDGSIFEFENGGGLGEIGSTEVFSESAEPPLPEDDLEAAMAAFQAMFPEGEYEFEGETVEGQRLTGSAMLFHALPAAPEMIFPDPDAEENIADPEDTSIVWADTSVAGDPPITRYEVVVEFEVEETEEVFTLKVEVPADPDAPTQSVDVPESWFEGLADLDGEYKAEVVAIAADRNATIAEVEFELEDDEEEEAVSAGPAVSTPVARWGSNFGQRP